MSQPPVSVVVVSRDRPAALMRCVLGLSQLDYAQLELIVVACPKGRDALLASPHAQHLKLVVFDEANISAARNLGIAQAAGEIVAFIDDDAVPEPTWLQHLVAPFASSDAAASGGYVIGRNGISFQWTARSVDRHGRTTAIDLNGSAPVELRPQPNRAIKTEGTNMAVRRDVLADLGGFDPSYRFYLDETDFNLRLADEGLTTALVPLARVHHGYDASARRFRDRTPKDLTEIAASQAVFLRKFCASAQRSEAKAAFRREQWDRVMRLMQRGPLGADDAARLMRGWDRGYAKGAVRDVSSLARIPRAPDAFRPFPTRPKAERSVIAGRVWQAKTLRSEAKDRALSGYIVSLFIFSPTARPHRVQFTADGVWEQTGGLWGRSKRQSRMFQPWQFSARLAAETKRVAPVRGRNNVVKPR